MSFFSENLNIQLNPMQAKAVDHFKGPGLVLAIPGSGKTTLLICRTMHLIRHHQVAPHRILSLTFSKAAALDMNHRFKSLFPNQVDKVSFSTIHRFCYGILLNYFRKINRTYHLLESKESPISKQKLLREIYSKHNHAFLTEDLAEDLASDIGYIKNMMIDPGKYESNIKNFEAIFKDYEAYKKEGFLMDFDDMLTMAYTLLSKKADILKYYQDKFDFIQVDECQDTSKVQHMIIQLLGQSHKNIFMVADDDQSIYGFRGAYPEMIVHAKDHYPGIRTYALNINYRSSNTIVDLCQNVISSNSIRHEKDFQGNSPTPAQLKLVYVDTTTEQVEYIIDAYKATDASQAVLYRNNLSMVALVDRLHRRDVDFSLKDIKNTFFGHWITQDILAFMRLALVPNDIQALERIYFKTNAYLSKENMSQIKDHNRGINLFDTMIDLPQMPAFKQKTLKKLKSNFEYLAQLKPELAVEFIEDTLAYKSYLTQQAQKINTSIQHLSKHIDILKLIAKECLSLSDFMNRLEDLKSIIYQASKNTNPYALKLLTMHASKGLEFDYVYLADIDETTFPSKWAVDQFDEGDVHALEEERRLYYVALSRAKTGITLVHTKFKNGQYNKASCFVKEFIDSSSSIAIEHFKKTDKPVKLQGFEIGDKVLHTSFGVGVLVDLEGDRVMIEFKDMTKTLSASLCNDKKILMKM